MIPGFEAIVEKRIKNAQRKGEFDNLQGSNKPLKFDDLNIPEELRLAHKILKNSGFLPPEVEIRKQITRTEQLLETVSADSPEKHKIQKKLNYLLTKLRTARENRSFSPGVADTYRNRMIKKMS